MLRDDYIEEVSVDTHSQVVRASVAGATASQHQEELHRGKPTNGYEFGTIFFSMNIKRKLLILSLNMM